MNALLWLVTTVLCFALSVGVALASDPVPEQATPPAAGEGALLDLNLAGVAQLEQLPGIGEKRALAIIAFRDSHGGFRSVTQLLQIKGIGRAMLRKLRPLVTVGAEPRAGAVPGSEAIHRVR